MYNIYDVCVYIFKNKTVKERRVDTFYEKLKKITKIRR